MFHYHTLMTIVFTVLSLYVSVGTTSPLLVIPMLHPYQFIDESVLVKFVSLSQFKHWQDCFYSLLHASSQSISQMWSSLPPRHVTGQSSLVRVSQVVPFRF
ncbi:hypothetical protein EDD22DRAFT_322347 [Suillus occidentalis]|nr:hypothetical protein EDD22DRAFT_322347 [Suillus occidentalis]